MMKRTNSPSSINSRCLCLWKIGAVLIILLIVECLTNSCCEVMAYTPFVVKAKTTTSSNKGRNIAFASSSSLSSQNFNDGHVDLDQDQDQDSSVSDSINSISMSKSGSLDHSSTQKVEEDTNESENSGGEAQVPISDMNMDTYGPFEPMYYNAYTEAMEEVISSFRVQQKKDTNEDLEAARSFLFSPNRLVPILPAIDSRISSSSSSPSPSTLSESDNMSTSSGNSQQTKPQPQSPPSKNSFRDALMEQRDIFTTETEMSQGQRQLSQRALTYMGDYCAKMKTSLPLYVSWEKIKEAGISPRDHTLSAYLYSLTSMEEATETTTFDAKVDAKVEVDDDISGQVAIYHDLLYQPTENTASIQIKKLVDQGKANEAEEILSQLSSLAKHEEGMNVDDVEQQQTPLNKKKKKKNDAPLLKLRTFLPVLSAYCEEGDASSALRLYDHMKREPAVYLDDKTYTLLISSLARMGYFRSDCDSSNQKIEKVETLQCFSSSSPEYAGAGAGPKLFDEIASQMADDILEISSDCAKDIRNAFVVGFAGSKAIENLSQVPYDCTLAPVQFRASDDELVACRVTIPQNDVECPRTNAQLRLIQLEQHQKSHVHDTLLQMADTQFEAHENMLNRKQQQQRNFKKGGKNKNRNKNNNKNTNTNKPQEENIARKHLESFAQWLDSREGKPFTAIVDGANVAYYGLGNVNYHHIALMVQTLEDMGENPLVIIPQKYAQQKFYLRQGYVQELHPSQMDVLSQLEQEGKIYKVPHRCLDDYYWMLSSVSKQSVSCNGTNMDVLPNNEEDRWPGARPMLITNDQMRDHKLELLEPRLFRRWSSSFIVNYDFPPLPSDRRSDNKEITFQPADFFSREIQGNPSNGDDIAWHFPVSEWERNDRFCIRIPKI